MNAISELIDAGGGLSQFLGFVLGVTGAALVASNRPYSRYGFPLFLAANFAMIDFAIHAHATWLLAQQVAFTATSCWGLLRNGFLSRRSPQQQKLNKS